MNRFAVQLELSRRAIPENAAVGNIDKTRRRRRHDIANRLHQNGDRAIGSAQHNHRRMQARLLFGKVEKPVQSHNGNGGSPQIEEACQARRHTRRSEESRHRNYFPDGIERKSAAKSARVKNQQVLRVFFQSPNKY